MNKTLQKFILYSINFVGTLVFLYAVYWLAKHGSYYYWYEGLVKQTIQELVKQEALK